MGLPDNSVKFLFAAKTKGVRYDTTLMLGRQQFYSSASKVVSFAAMFKQTLGDTSVLKEKYSEPLFKLLGADVADSIDFSDYEGATVIHDLNERIPDSLKGLYTAVVDAGTLEHVFNFPIAIKNCMEMLKEGGHFIGITPANNQMGHGFYQVSPELYYRVFAPENGFEIKGMYISSQNEDGSVSDWYQVADPLEARSRVVITNNKQINLLVIAKRIATVSIFKNVPQQSDYVHAWATTKSLKENIKPEEFSWLKFFYRKWVPAPIKNFVGNIMNLFKKPLVVNEDLGLFNPDHFQKTEF